VVFIQETRFTRGGGTNRKGAAGNGWFRVGKQVWRGRYKRRVSGRRRVIVYWVVVSLSFEQMGCSETSAYNNQTPGKYPKEYIQDSKHDESLKSRIVFRKQMNIYVVTCSYFGYQP